MDIKAAAWEILPIRPFSTSPHTIRSHPLALVLHPCTRIPIRGCVVAAPAGNLKVLQRMMKTNEYMVKEKEGIIVTSFSRKRWNYAASAFLFMV